MAIRLTPHRLFLHDRPFQREPGALVGLAGDGDVAAVFAEDFLADGEADAGATGAFGGFEEIEDVLEAVVRDAGTVV